MTVPRYPGKAYLTRASEPNSRISQAAPDNDNDYAWDLEQHKDRLCLHRPLLELAHRVSFSDYLVITVVD